MKLKLIGVTVSMALYSLTINAQDGEALFKQNCSACHSIGKGKLVGPDLKGVNTKRSEEWIINFVKNAQAFGEKDADAKAIITEYGYPMPNQNVSDADIKAIISHIAANSPAEAVAETTEAAPVEAAPAADPALDPANASKEAVLAGLNIFSGKQRLENGGVSCISCHNVNHDDLVAGGLLAKDLTKVYERMGSAGINGILSAPPFPAMASSYKDNPLTEKEIFQLAAFFNSVSKEDVYSHQRAYNDNILLYGGGVAFLVIVSIILLMFIERKRKCVKEDIYKRQIKSACSK
ncbi:MAG: c-type cytochrome [Flavobacteriales bacterium]|nr:c-type cytochrome [Flavobacteriales bacterium]MCL4856069.1 cytochrome c [Flavobacteriales bacterium]